MLLAYFDESGDQGWEPGASDWFVLSCLLVSEADWLPELDALIALRRRLKQRWGISSRPELKAQHLRWGKGPLEGLGIGLRDRMNIFKDLMEYQEQNLRSSVFALAVDKRKLYSRSRDAREWAWTMALERVDRCCQDRSERAMIFPDSGHAAFIRKLLRKMRRIHGVGGHYGGRLPIPVQLIVEDPADKQSHDSYLTQVADWNAYAARRSRYIEPVRKVPDDLWDRIPSRLLTEVNRLKGGPPGIAMFP